MKAYSAQVRKYYKYGNILNADITQVGGTYSNGNYSTSANGQALRLPILPLNTASSWEFQLVYTYNGGGSYPSIIAPSTQSYGIQLVISSGQFYISLSSAGGTADSGLFVSQTTGVSVTIGTTYYIKFGFTGSQYYFKYNIDGSDTYTDAWSFTSSTKVYSSVALWLMNWGWTNVTRWSAGPMEMSKFRVYINESLYLTGTVPERSTPENYDYYVDEPAYQIKCSTTEYFKNGTVPNGNIIGSPTVNGSIMSGFSGTSGLQIPSYLATNTNTEYVFCIITGSDVTGNQPFAHAQPIVDMSIYEGYLSYYNHGAATHHNIVAASTNTKYWVKQTINGTSKSYSYSTDGTTWSTPSTITDSSTSVAPLYGFVLGHNANPADWAREQFFKGSMDLSECYIKFGDTLVWKGTKGIPATSSDYDYYLTGNFYKAIKSYEKGQYYGN